MQKITSRFARTSILIVGAWLTLFVLAPQLMLFIATFLQRGQQEFITSTFTLENYARLLDPVFLFIFWESFRLAGVTTLACLCWAIPLRIFWPPAARICARGFCCLSSSPSGPTRSSAPMR